MWASRQAKGYRALTPKETSELPILLGRSECDARVLPDAEVRLEEDGMLEWTLKKAKD